MRFVTSLSLVAVLLLAAHTTAAPKAGIPSLMIEGDEGMVALALDSVRIDVLIRGHLARTSFELTYRNDLDHDIDGSFTFPLPPDAEVSEVGLYFDGKLRNAEAVERVKARSAYEETVHRGVDPALAEWSGSTRAFRFRVYPIPANGTKVVHIAYDEELTSRPYQLDLRYAIALKEFDLTIDSEGPVESDGVVLRRSGNQWSASSRAVKLDGTIRATRAARETAFVSWSAVDGMWYAAAPVRVRSSARKVSPSSHVTLLVDTSSSAVQRDSAKLRDFLAAFAARQESSASVRVIPFHIAVDSALETNAPALETTLSGLPLAGATNLVALLEGLPAIAASVPADSRLILVTDGIETLGAPHRLARAIESLKKLRRPLTVVNASPSADDHVLAGMARATDGWYLDLSQNEAAMAVDAAMRVPIGADMSGAEPSVVDMLPDALLVSSDREVAVSARSRERILHFDVFAGSDRYDLPVRQVDSGKHGDLVIRAWARAQLRALLARGASAEEVRDHGLRFNQLTPQTSLLVLDTWQDYERHGIPVPADLREQRDADLAEAAAASAGWTGSGSITLRGVMNGRFANAAAWFMKGVVSTGGSPLPGVTITKSERGQPDFTTVSNAEGEFWLTAARMPGAFTVRAQLEGLNTVTRAFPRDTPRGTIIEIEMRMAAVSEAITVTASAPEVETASSQASSLGVSLVNPTPSALADQLLSALVTGAAPLDDDELASVSIALRLQRIDAVIAKLRSLRSPDERFRYYVAARSVVGGEKLFQAEAALAMHEDAPELAVRALTDLAEAYPNDAPTLRLLGRVLDGWGRAGLARLLFERALDLAPLETQTWRELMLLAAKTGDENELARLQRRFDTESRDERMDQTETAILAELQRRRAGTDPRIDNTSALQVEAMWDSDYTDVDLHIVEPSGEEVFYSHRNSAKGGLLHDDVTSGFGPETYTLPKLDAGTYQIVLTYYAGDETRYSLQTLAHVIIYVNGERRDHFVALTAGSERKVVATVTW
jgi:Ca-activated chloride channel family protein